MRKPKIGTVDISVSVNYSDIIKIKEALLHLKKVQKYDKKKFTFLIETILKMEQKANETQRKHSKTEIGELTDDKTETAETENTETEVKAADIDNIETKQRQPYSVEEDKSIINYFLEKGGVSRQKGVAIWKEMAEESIIPNRSWQSMKSRWDIVSKNLAAYQVTAEQLNAAETQGDQDQDQNQENVEAITPSVTPKFSRGYRRNANYYTVEEDQKILGFILENKRFCDTTGTSLWKSMVEQNIVPDRTWLSLKERFRKIILPNIDKFEMSPEDREEFGEVTKGRKKGKVQNGSKDGSDG